VVVTGCPDGACTNRLGVRWTEQRIDGLRDPRLRAHVPRERVARVWAARHEKAALAARIAAFRALLAALPDPNGAPRSRTDAVRETVT
jgi:coenzyme F420-reducing hydrogenase delta subunit